MRFIVIEKIYGLPTEIVNNSVHKGNWADVPVMILATKECYVLEVDEEKFPELISKYRWNTEKQITENVSIIPDKNLDNKDSDGVPLARNRAFANADGFRFRGQGVSRTVTAGQEQNIDLILSEERYINGGRIKLENENVDDTYCFQVVHPTYGVVDEFVTNWTALSGMEFKLDYPAKIPAGLTLRLKYKSVGGIDVNVYVDFFLHKKV